MFSDKIIRWYEENQRQLPWRNIRDPYKIWLSEIILQQTRIEQGRAYYDRFVDAFPTVDALAEASEEEVLKMWQGLGYYSRARNLYAAARFIVSQLHGRFPTTYEGVLGLKGVGRYTAAAIVSFAYRMPYPVIDGNVYRLVARLFGISTPIGTNSAYKEFEQRLFVLIDKQRPDLFNQAMMDFGSTFCKPSGCDCEGCIFSRECVAWQTGRVNSLPVRGKLVKTKERYFLFLDIRWNTGTRSYTVLQQRNEQDIWKGLFQFPLIETSVAADSSTTSTLISEWLAHHLGVSSFLVGDVWQATHKLTHQTLHATFFPIVLSETPIVSPTSLLILPSNKLNTYPIPRLIERYLLQKA
ncbi:MAG: A/G-specific adenine glycosylase [Bacteroidales bacterium]|nr:A/G-specific adenine glycosylase [Bacteroidales bacterium]